ncbi:MAG: mechanosensitive ion channel family protein [Bacteroidales bacterium]|nr:mechanosensitive ion channel family protein [Bacteroidales bacterium]
MVHLIDKLNDFLTGKLRMASGMADFADDIIAIAALVAIGFGINWICQGLFSLISRHSSRMHHSRWHHYMVKRRLGHHFILLIPGIIIYFLLYLTFDRGSHILILLHRIDIVYLLIVAMVIANSMLLAFLDFYSTTEKNRNRPLQGLVQGLQIVMFFTGSIICIAVLIDKSPTALLTGLGASAAVLMLIFKDSILGFVSGVQLMQNDMIKLGDWIQMTDGSANGVVEEITLNTIKVRNWDNTITTIPPYTFVSTPVKNWRGMQESGGRRVDKRLFIDMKTIKPCSKEEAVQICRDIPMLTEYVGKVYPADKAPGTETGGGPKAVEVPSTVTNSQLYRAYIEEYLRNHPIVNKDLDLIIAQREPTQSGLPVEVYFFLADKVWNEFETIQSDIFDHLIAMAPSFGLELYQLPSQI